MKRDIETLAREYESFLSGFPAGESLSEKSGHQAHLDPPNEIILQMAWLDGLYGRELTDDRGRSITIIHPGGWNRIAGPDFLNAEITIDGVPARGDIELDKHPEDWERHGHGENPAFNNVILHLACTHSAATWYTRNERHESVPLAILPAKALTAHPVEEDVRKKRLRHCVEFFAGLDDQKLEQFLLSVAAYRLDRKRKDWNRQAALSGRDQTLYEGIAESLGYTANKVNMRHLAKRVPLNLARENPEPLLYGTAGFLVPLLRESCDEQTRHYHKLLWDYWWTRRDQYELSSTRGFLWTNSGLRPANHPQRRLAALALLVSRWEEVVAMASMSHRGKLMQLLTSLSHPYWDHHVMLPSPRRDKPMALIGRERALDMIINHIAVMDDSSGSWEAYLQLPGSTPSSIVLQTAKQLLGDDKRARIWTRKAWQQQAFLQISRDYCSIPCRESCRLPQQAREWMEQDLPSGRR